MTAPRNRVAAIGEAMVEMAPVGEGLYCRAFAGDTFNTIWHMALLLGDRATCRYVTRIGTDTISDAFAAEIAADGLDPTGILRDAERTMGLYLIELDGAERSFHYWRSQSAARRLADDAAALGAAIGDASLVHLSGITLGILPTEGLETLFRALADARARGARIAFDPNLRPRLWASPDDSRTAFARMYELTDIALPSFDDEAALWGDGTPTETLRRLSEAGIGEIAVKNGGGPVHLRAEGATAQVETPEATDVRDTSGAGDAFDAGYLAARLSGSAPADAVPIGQALAREVLACPGARATRERVARVAQMLDRLG